MQRIWPTKGNSSEYSCSRNYQELQIAVTGICGIVVMPPRNQYIKGIHFLHTLTTYCGMLYDMKNSYYSKHIQWHQQI